MVQQGILFVALFLGAKDDAPRRSPPPLVPAAGTMTMPDVVRALDFIIARQNADGSFGESNRLATTAICGMAMLSAGSTPEHGEFASQVSGALRFVVQYQSEGGLFFHENSSSPMHNHGYALLFVTQCYGMTEASEDLRIAITRGIRATVLSQHPNGGFGYYASNKSPGDLGRRGLFNVGADETSVTVTQLQALRAARNVGFGVPIHVIELVRKYLVACQETETGAFIYSLEGFYGKRIRSTSFAITAALLCVLQSTGEYSGERVNRAVDWGAGFSPHLLLLS